MKTAEEILTLVIPLQVFDDVAIEGGVVRFLDRFTCNEGEEPHDIAWDRLRIFRDALEPSGLRIEDSGSDNDSLWGRIVEGDS